MEYIEGPHRITYRVKYKGRYLEPESITVQCHVSYDEAFRYVQNYWGYGYDDGLEILAVEPTERTIAEHQMRLDREREREERESRYTDPEVHRYRMKLGK